MSQGAGEIDYDERQALAEYRPDHPERPRPAALLLANLLPGPPADDSAETGEQPDEVSSADLSGPDVETLDAAELSRYEQEALIVAARMRSLHETGTAWKDMTVLSRTRSIGQIGRAHV